MPLPNPSVEDPASQRNFQDLDKRIPTPGTYPTLAVKADTKIAFGADTIDIAAAQFAAKTITHGLGTTPTAVLITAGTSTYNTWVDTIGATTFQAGIRTIDASTPTATIDIYWIAIG